MCAERWPVKCWCTTGVALTVSAGEWIYLLGEMSHAVLSVLVLRENDTIFQKKKKKSLLAGKK